jgi:nicotinate-nucleotide adenylyltransferase
MKNTDLNSLPSRTGLFGGTFDPIHIGHLRVAMDVAARYDLERVYFIPSALPPHKTNEALAPVADRYEMVRLALAGHDALQASDVETHRQGPSYSCDTVRYFKARVPESGRLYFLVGADAFMEIHTWRDYSNLFDQVAFIVMSRPPADTAFENFVGAVKRYVQYRISPHYKPAKEGTVLVHTHKQTIYLTAVTPVAIASTQIRRMIRGNQPIDAWVTPAVADYIKKRGLYR